MGKERFSIKLEEFATQFGLQLKSARTMISLSISENSAQGIFEAFVNNIEGLCSVNKCETPNKPVDDKAGIPDTGHPSSAPTFEIINSSLSSFLQPITPIETKIKQEPMVTIDRLASAIVQKSTQNAMYKLTKPIFDLHQELPENVASLSEQYKHAALMRENLEKSGVCELPTHHKVVLRPWTSEEES
jgi:hypothetical protein